MLRGVAKECYGAIELNARGYICGGKLVEGKQSIGLMWSQRILLGPPQNISPETNPLLSATS